MAKKQELTAPGAPGEIALTGNVVEQINWLHAQAQATAAKAEALATNASHLAVVLGLQLGRLKAELPHGEFGKLFADDESSEAKSEPRFRFKFSDRTARKYMAAAEGALERPGLPAAQRKLLVAMASAEIPNDAQPVDGSPLMFAEDVRAALNTATRGQTLRQLYLDLGIIKGDATERGGGGGSTGGGGVDDGKKPGEKKLKLPELTPEEMWEVLYRTGLGDVDRFFLRKEHRLLSKNRVEDLKDTLRGWLDDLNGLKF